MDTFVELRGKFCPFPVVNVITEVEQMQTGEKKTFYVDDPLAIKSIPEELEEEGVRLEITKIDKGWEIEVTKE